MAREAPLLRRQLLKWLLVPLLLLLAADTFFSYWMAVRFAQRAYDVALVDIGREVSLHVKRGRDGVYFDMPEAAQRVLFTDPADTLHFEVAAPDGALIAGRQIPRTGAAAGDGETLYDGTVDAEPVRIVERRLSADGPTRPTLAVVRVAETKNRRNALAREILVSVVAPQVLLILIAAGLVWVGIVRGLMPLRHLQEALATRSHRDRSPIVVDEVPGEVRPLMNEINALLERLDAVLTLQNRFIADAAHQLKTPVAGLQAQLELTLRDEDPRRMRESLAKLSTGLDRLSRLVSQLLALARNEPDAARHITMSEIDLNVLALESASGWVPEALRKGIDLGYDGADTPLPVRGDPIRLRELLDNLIDNAIRYSRDGGRVTVKVLAQPVPTVAVSDDGPGIPPEERQRIFERFHRRLGVTGADGSGLGLAIAQEIATIHGGHIDLREDVDGIGNTFSVSLPRAG
jgi:two-component system, OmpR family, sensor histidine kinase TctE